MHSVPVYTVSQLNHEAKHMLEHTFEIIRLAGEVSNFVCAPSGHLYFSLKDKDSQIRCAFFRYKSQCAAIDIRNGQEIIVQARVTLYAPRGEFQLVVHSIESTTDGALQKAFEQLKNKLAAEGLFAAEYKKPIPDFPQTVGVITSPTGAALQDILNVLKRRCPVIAVIVYPTLVQGPEAPGQIVQAIEKANHDKKVDVLLLARGGGSLEDLWSFNEEKVARAIFKSQLPLISGVGHEIDFTIADFVADYRAPTPSAAAECVSPDTRAWRTKWEYFLQRLNTLILHQLQNKQQSLDGLQKRLRHPSEKLRAHLQNLSQLQHRLSLSFSHQFKNKQVRLQTLSQQLHALSPLQTLQRGYAIATDTENHILLDSQSVRMHDKIHVLLAHGKLICDVLEKN